MSAAIATRGSLVVKTAAHITASGLDTNEEQTPENIEAGIPAAPISYYMTLEKSGQDTLRGPVFQGAGFEWDGVILPATGTWVARVRKVEDDSSVVNANVVVTAED